MPQGVQVYKNTAAAGGFDYRYKVGITCYQNDVTGYVVKTYPGDIQSDLYIYPLLFQVGGKTAIGKRICTVTGRLERPSVKGQRTLPNREKGEQLCFFYEPHTLGILWAGLKIVWCV
jgi:hypothetical protein